MKNTQSPRVPESLVQFLPSSDIDACAEPLEESGYVVSGAHALILVDEGGVTNSGMWYEIQFVRWSRKKRELVVRWVDPYRDEIRVITESKDPREFMEDVSGKVNRSFVRQDQAEAGNGTRISVAIRRRHDGVLFSTLVSSGPLDPDGEELAHHLESKLREDVGLE